MWCRRRQMCKNKTVGWVGGCRKTRDESPGLSVIFHFLWEPTRDGLPKATSEVARPAFVSFSKKISAPAAPNKASINSVPARAARGTKSPTPCPGPQTSLETNGAGICQNRITRSVSPHTFTYLSAYSGPFQKGNINRERSDTIAIATSPPKIYGCPSKEKASGQGELFWCCYTHSKAQGAKDIQMLHLKTRRKSIDKSSSFHRITNHLFLLQKKLLKLNKVFKYWGKEW